MTADELAARLAVSCEKSVDDVADTLQALVDLIDESLGKGEAVTVRNLGTFHVSRAHRPVFAPIGALARRVSEARMASGPASPRPATDPIPPAPGKFKRVAAADLNQYAAALIEGRNPPGWGHPGYPLVSAPARVGNPGHRMCRGAEQ